MRGHFFQLQYFCGEITVMGMADEFRSAAAKLINLRKLGVDSSIKSSLKGEKLKGRSPPFAPGGAKKHNFVLVEEIQARMDKIQENLHDEEHHCRDEQEVHLKQFDDEPIKSYIPEATERKKIFIRSRL